MVIFKGAYPMQRTHIGRYIYSYRYERFLFKIS